MRTIQIQKGRNIPLDGAAQQKLETVSLPSHIAIQPTDFRGLQLRLLVHSDDTVMIGTPILEDKKNPLIKVVSPASGKVVDILRGEKRSLRAIIIKLHDQQKVQFFKQYTEQEINTLDRDTVLRSLFEGGLWPCIRQRPFSRIALPQYIPKSIFVQAMNSEPLALNIDFILQGREKEFQLGLDILRLLSPGDVHVCCHQNVKSAALTLSKNVKIHNFCGPHPAGNVSTHLHWIDPIRKGDIVWYIQAEDVLRIAVLFLKGVFSPEKNVALTGASLHKRVYKKTILGAPLSFLLENENLINQCCLSGSVLSGEDVGPEGFLRFYDNQITVIPKGGRREFLGWILPGRDKYTFSKTFLSCFFKTKKLSLTQDRYGSDRAIVLNDVYDKYVPLNILTFFLIRAILAKDLDEAERLGLLECDEEDFALCSFACPSKINVGSIIREGLTLIENEGYVPFSHLINSCDK